MANKPYVVVEWNDTETDAKGWMCAYNFVGHYCGGGTRMHPTVTKEEVIRLATTMGYKYKACESLTTGGCKAGIAYDYKAPDARMFFVDSSQLQLLILKLVFPLAATLVLIIL